MIQDAMLMEKPRDIGGLPDGLFLLVKIHGLKNAGKKHGQVWMKIISWKVDETTSIQSYITSLWSSPLLQNLFAVALIGHPGICFVQDLKG